LDTDYLEISETVTLNGRTAVNYEFDGTDLELKEAYQKMWDDVHQGPSEMGKK
ncbi:hypothetical protein LCGC14_1801770, partial [marine sediment metagenome]